MSVKHGEHSEAHNFVAKYGRARLRDIIARFERGESGQVIAWDFGVSRERVRQWKNTFGTLIIVYQVDPGCARLAKGP